MHGKIDTKNADMNEFMFTPPKTTLIGTNHDLLYSRQSFFVQSPTCQVLEFDPINGHIKFQFYKEDDLEAFQLFCGLNGLFFRHLKEEYPGIDFIHTVHCGHVITIAAKIPPSVLYFDSNYETIISEDVKEGDHIICLLKTKGLWVNETTGTMKWTAFQILKFIQEEE